MRAHPTDDALTRLRRQAALLPAFQVPCRSQPDDWFSEYRHILLRAQAKCLGAGAWPCPLLLLCREAGRAGNEQHGVWGGETPGERRKALRKAAQGAAIPTPREDTPDGTVQEQAPQAATG